MKNRYFLLLYLFFINLIIIFNTESHPELEIWQYDNGHKEPFNEDVFQEAVNDLLDDTNRWNLWRGEQLIYHYLNEHNLPFYKLLPFLYSEDYQQRHAMAQIIKTVKPGYIGDRLLEVMVEGLQNDMHPWSNNPKWNRDVYSGLNNAEFGIKELQKPTTAKYAKKHLIKGCYSDDWQQNLFCALLLIKTDLYHEHLEQIIDILLENTKDDGIYDNCLLSIGGLYKLGPSICPILLKKYNENIKFDMQQKNSIRYLFHCFNYIPEGWDNVNTLGGSKFFRKNLYHKQFEEYDDWPLTKYFDRFFEKNEIFRWP